MSVRFEDRTRQAKTMAGNKLKAALTSAAIQLEGEIAIRTPVDTGRLRASISYIAPLSRSLNPDDDDKLTGIASEKAAYVGTNVEYAPYVEYGTRYQKAQPYMRTGFAAAKDDIERIMQREMKADD